MTGPRPKSFDANHDRFKKSAKHEERVAKELNGRALLRSGGLAWSPSDKTTAGGDLKTAQLMVEHKRAEPQTKSIGVKRAWLKKVSAGAKRAQRIPAMVLTYEQADGHEQDWLVLPMSVAERLIRSYFSESEHVSAENPSGS